MSRLPPDDELVEFFREDGGFVQKATLDSYDKFGDLHQSLLSLAFLRQFVEKSLRQQKHDFDLAFCILDSPQINAQTFTDMTRGFGVVAINSGAIISARIFNLFLEWIWMMYSKGGALDVNWLLDSEDRVLTLRSLWPGNLLFEVSDAEMRMALANHLSQSEYSSLNKMVLFNLSSMFSSEYFVFHEFAHFLLGHSGYAQNQFGVMRMRMFDASSTVTEDLLLMELAADALVGKIIGQVICARRSPATRICELPNLSHEDFMEAWSMAIVMSLLVFAVLDDRPHTMKLFGFQGYPHAAFRCRTLVDAVATTLTRFEGWRYRGLAKKWLRIYQMSHVLTTRVFAAMSDGEQLFRVNPGPVYYLRDKHGAVDMYDPFAGFSADAEVLYKQLSDRANRLSKETSRFALKIKEVEL